MNHYLVQHGMAKTEAEDPERPLTAAGRREVERMAGAAARWGLSVSTVLHSGKLRARQSAEILAAALVPAQGPRAVDGFGPKDDPETARELLEKAAAPTMLVGHLPHLSRLTARLVTGSAEGELVSFRNSGIVCLTGEPGAWRVRWIVTPECLPAAKSGGPVSCGNG